MAVDHGYVSLAGLKAALGETGSDSDDPLERAIEAASRQIDEFCNRQFWAEESATAREFLPTAPDVVWTGDFVTDTGVTVEVDPTDAGIWEPLNATNWRAQPFTRRRGRPFDRVAARNYQFRWWGGGASVKVTARWGWETVPKDVEQACLVLAIDHWKSKDLTGGVAGFGEFGAVRLAAVNPQARALLTPLRDPLEP